MRIPGQGREMSFDMTIDLYDFGPKRKAKPPPPDETFDATNGGGAGARTTP
jgi:hypothetical protein